MNAGQSAVPERGTGRGVTRWNEEDVMRHLSETRGASRNRLFELFPYGYPGQACKIAGMRRPRVRSTG